jgi:hypothetical protein
LFLPLSARWAFFVSHSAARQKTIHWQTEQNEGSEGGEAGVVGVASAKRALSFGTRPALIRTDSTRPALWAVHPCEPKWGQVARQRHIGFAVVFRFLGAALRAGREGVTKLADGSVVTSSFGH